MKRLFVAVDVDDNTRRDVARIAESLRASLQSRASWVQPDRMHLTVEFLGEVDEAAEQRVAAALAEPFIIAPFSLRFSGLGFFPSSGPPRVLWLGIVQGRNELGEIHRDLRQRLGNASAQKREEFNPHLTLARFRDRMPRPRFAGITRMKAEAGPCRIDRVTLYESRLSPKGPSYTALADAALKPCTPAPSSS